MGYTLASVPLTFFTGEHEGRESGERVKIGDGKTWAQSVMDRGYDLLIVSQFTLFGTLQKGNKPDFHRAMVTLFLLLLSRRRLLTSSSSFVSAIV